MNRHSKMLIYSVSIMLLIAGCAREAAVPVREGYITVKEKEWLEKHLDMKGTAGYFYILKEGHMSEDFNAGF